MARKKLEKRKIWPKIMYFGRGTPKSRVRVGARPTQNIETWPRPRAYHQETRRKGKIPQKSHAPHSCPMRSLPENAKVKAGPTKFTHEDPKMRILTRISHLAVERAKIQIWGWKNPGESGLGKILKFEFNGVFRVYRAFRMTRALKNFAGWRLSTEHFRAENHF